MIKWDMNEKIIMITGAGGALGSALAERYAQQGATLALVTGRTSHESIVTTNALRLAADLSDPAAAADAVATVLKQFGRIDALFNLAGGFAASSAAATTSADAELQLDLNFRSASNTTTAALPAMLGRGEGFILGVAAAAAINGARGASAYAASKGAVLSYFRSLALELAPQGIRTSVLVPIGTIDTPANRAAMPKADHTRFMPLQELVDALLFLESRSLRAQVTELRIHS
jgi:NAD(P)-dependent dehydrogenase (short-subunit alcohol dehydrogenase family)